MPRAQTILSRFPAHFEAVKAGKRLSAVVAALSRDIDVQSAQLAAIRRAHRLLDVDEMADLMLIANRHGIGESALAILSARFERAGQLMAAVSDAGDAAARNTAAEVLLRVWGLDGPEPKLALFANASDPGTPVDLEGPDGELAAAQLAVAVALSLQRRAFMDAARTRIIDKIANQASGNGTVRALLTGSANALDLDIGPIHSSDDRYLHAAFAQDRLGLQPAADADQLQPAREVIGLEENPQYRVETDQLPRKHGELFDHLRRGFERATLQISITGEGERTHGPMFVNRDEGHGVGFAGQAAAGETLVFDEGGRVRRGEDDVTAFAYAWRGACFADRNNPNDNDFVFADAGDGAADDRVAEFAVGIPDGSLDPDFVFPHAGDDLPMPGIGIGRTRFAFFVQQAHFSIRNRPPQVPAIRRVPPRPAIGFFDASVFAAVPEETKTASALLSLSRLERRAHFVRILIPSRFRAFEDDPEVPELRRRIIENVQRHRPAGIALEVDFIEPGWTLGEGVLDTPDPEDPVAALTGGTVLWPAPETVTPIA